MKGDCEGDLRGRELLGKIRFGAMEQGYLEKARERLPEEQREWVEGLVREALRARAAVRAKAMVELRQLGPNALTRRRGRDVKWSLYSEAGDGRTLKRHSGIVRALAQCEGRMCSGSADGSIAVYSLATLEEERVMRIGGCMGSVHALAVWEGQLIGGHGSGRLCVWDAGTGQLRRELEGHSGSVGSLCVVGSRLACAFTSPLIRVWAMGPGPEWACERTLAGHTGWLASLAGWAGKLICGSYDKTVRVWDLGTGGLDATLAGHGGAVHGPLVHRGRLFSASGDGTIRVWAVGTWAAVASVQAYAAGASGQWPGSLAASGSKLVSGFESFDKHGNRCEVRVWGLDSLAYECTVRQGGGGGRVVPGGGGRAGVGGDGVKGGGVGAGVKRARASTSSALR